MSEQICDMKHTVKDWQSWVKNETAFCLLCKAAGFSQEHAEIHPAGHQATTMERAFYVLIFLGEMARVISRRAAKLRRLALKLLRPQLVVFPLWCSSTMWCGLLIWLVEARQMDPPNACLAYFKLACPFSSGYKGRLLGWFSIWCVRLASIAAWRTSATALNRPVLVHTVARSAGHVSVGGSDDWCLCF